MDLIKNAEDLCNCEVSVELEDVTDFCSSELNYRPRGIQIDVVRGVFQRNLVRDLEICWLFYVWRKEVNTSCRINVLCELNQFVSRVHGKLCFGRIYPRYRSGTTSIKSDLDTQKHEMESELNKFLMYLFKIGNVTSDEESDEDASDDLDDGVKVMEKLRDGIMDDSIKPDVTMEKCASFFHEDVSYLDQSTPLRLVS